MLTLQDGRCHNSLSGILTCDQPHASPELCHHTTVADNFFRQISIVVIVVYYMELDSVIGLLIVIPVELPC